jgi:hypothetical protein
MAPIEKKLTPPIDAAKEWTPAVPTVAILPNKDEQELEASKVAYSNFWTESSLGKKEIDPAQDFFRTPPVSAAKASQNNEVKLGTETMVGNHAREASIPPVHKTEAHASIFSSFFDWVSGLFSSAPSPAEQAAAKPMSEEDQAELKGTLAMLNALMTQIKEVQEMDTTDVKLEEHHMMAMLAKKEEIQIQTRTFHDLRKMKQNLERERFKKMAETIELAKKGEYGTKYMELASALQLFATAVGMSSGAAGVVLAAIAVGSALDTLLDDPVKKGIAGLFTSDKETVDQTVHYMKLGLGAVALVASATSAIGGAASGEGMTAAVELLKTTAFLVGGAATINQEYLKYRSRELKAVMLDFQYKIENNSAKFKGAMKQLKRLDDSMIDSYKQQHQTKSNEYEAIIAGFRN